VMTSDTKAATAFYSDVIGWRRLRHGERSEIGKKEGAVAHALPGPLSPRRARETEQKF
jgi:hypothetical protein